MKAGTKGATVRRDLATLSCLCSCAVSWDYIDANPVKQFSKRHIRESPPRTTYPTTEQVDRLIAHAPPMAGRIIRFLAETGMRQEEVCGLEWSQVSIQRREVRLTKTKTSSPRVVPLSDAAVGTLVGTPRHITSPYVFWHHDGKRHTRLRQQLCPDRPPSRSAIPVPRPAPRLRQPVPTGHGRHPSPSGDPRPPLDPDDHAVRPHGRPATSTGRWQISAPRPAQKPAQWERYLRHSRRRTFR